MTNKRMHLFTESWDVQGSFRTLLCIYTIIRQCCTYSKSIDMELLLDDDRTRTLTATVRSLPHQFANAGYSTTLL